MLRPRAALYNKDYRDRDDGQLFFNLQSEILRVLESFGGPPKHTFFADDCMVIFRNLGFLENKNFVRAVSEAKPDPTVYARLWRIWVLCWSFRARWGTPGVMVDCGTYNGLALEIALRYSVIDDPRQDGNSVYLYDLFDNPPIESKKADHGPNLFDDVLERFRWYEDTHIIKGSLPKVLKPLESEVTWCQIDLNSELSDLGVFETIYPSLTDGAIVIFDDYGFARYQRTQAALDSFLERKNSGRILELPTGQGLYVHRRRSAP